MVPASSRSKNHTLQKPVFIVSHLEQEKICKEVYDYLIRKKIQKLKDTVLQFNKLVKKILR
jgi:hypothetical protein